jgi:hypothetical protein
VVEHAAEHRVAEDEVVVADVGRAGEVALELGRETVGERHGAAAAARLGRAPVAAH